MTQTTAERKTDTSTAAGLGWAALRRRDTIIRLSVITALLLFTPASTERCRRARTAVAP